MFECSCYHYKYHCDIPYAWKNIKFKAGQSTQVCLNTSALSIRGEIIDISTTCFDLVGLFWQLRSSLWRMIHILISFSLWREKLKITTFSPVHCFNVEIISGTEWTTGKSNQRNCHSFTFDFSCRYLPTCFNWGLLLVISLVNIVTAHLLGVLTKHFIKIQTAIQILLQFICRLTVGIDGGHSCDTWDHSV